MSLVKRNSYNSDPFKEFDKIFENFGIQAGRGFMPAVDVYQDENNVYIEASLPGVESDKVNVVIENDTLIVEGSNEKKSEVDEKNYYRKEVSAGSFHRSISLPSNVDGDKAQADYENGILKIVVPKKEEVTPKKIKVNKKD